MSRFLRVWFALVRFLTRRPSGPSPEATPLYPESGDRSTPKASAISPASVTLSGGKEKL